MSLLPELEPLELNPGETVVRGWAADRDEKGLPRRGSLTLTSQRLAYQPVKMGGAITALGVLAGSPVSAGHAWSVALSDVASVYREKVERIGERGAGVVVELRWSMDTEKFFVIDASYDVADEIAAGVAKGDHTAGQGGEKWSLPANSVQNGLAVGGRLSLVGRSLVFLPSSFEKKLDELVGGVLQPLLTILGRDAPSEAREIPLPDIAAVEKLEGELDLSLAKEGGLRDRLLLRRKNGEEEVFVVGDLDQVLARISRCVKEAAGATP